MLSSSNSSKYNDKAHLLVYYDYETDQISMEKLYSLLLEPSRYSLSSVLSLSLSLLVFSPPSKVPLIYDACMI